MADHVWKFEFLFLEFEPLNILQDLAMDVNVVIPSVSNGLPSAGFIDQGDLCRYLANR